MILDELTTGYFANETKWTKVHLVENGKPICGSRIGPTMSFQWCSYGITFHYIECEKCKERAIDIAKASNKVK